MRMIDKSWMIIKRDKSWSFMINLYKIECSIFEFDTKKWIGFMMIACSDM